MATILATNPHLVEATSGTRTWQEAVRCAIRQAQTLLSALGLPLDLYGNEPETSATNHKFPLFVPWEFVARMQAGRADDPLLLQVLPRASERLDAPGFASDPVGDLDSEVVPGLLKKYRSRALMVTTGRCAVHCRYCFRREFPYDEVPKSPAAWQVAIDAIAADETVEEVILSGGDPLMLADSSLKWLVTQLNAIPHVVRLRIHSRTLVVIPQRICQELLEWIDLARMPVVMVTHINHPNEIDHALRSALGRLRDRRVMLLNQSVLLRDINDSVETLRQLSTGLLSAGVLPYYLHQLDRVRGAAHFEVPIEEGRRIVSELRTQMSGYGVPEYVAEIAGQASKTPLT